VTHAVRTHRPSHATAPAAEPAARRAAAPPFVDNSARGAELRELTQLMRNGPAAAARRRGLRGIFGAAARLPADQTAGPIQRKIMINAAEYQPVEADGAAIIGPAHDGYLRDYESETEMRAHLGGRPSQVGLIENRALWYRIAYLPDRFFVYGESHSAVRGPAVKAASNIAKPILYEADPGWAAGEFGALDKGEATVPRGMEEHSSKLLRALELWRSGIQQEQRRLNGVAAPVAPDPLESLRPGEGSTRYARDGSHRLIVRGDDDRAKWWKPEGATEPPPNTYDYDAEARAAINGLFLKVFGGVINSYRAAGYHANLKDAWQRFQDETWNTQNGPQAQLNFKWAVCKFMLEGTQKMVLEKFKAVAQEPYASQNAITATLGETEPGQVTADTYRDEFMLMAILKGRDAGVYAFAALGDGHLQRLKPRLSRADIPFIDVQAFFSPAISKTAVETPKDKV